MKLFIDSATSYLYLAITSESVNDAYIRFGKNDHSETLVDNVKLFLDKNHVNVKDINEIVIGRGPGSYTGIRITGTVGKVFAYATNVAFSSFSSLDLLLASHLDQDGKYMARIIAKKDNSYIKVVEVINGKINIIVDDAYVNDDELNKYSEYETIMVSEENLNHVELAQAIEKYKLTRKEDFFTYAPNYLRSSI